jgi:hypothetical protein
MAIERKKDDFLLFQNFFLYLCAVNIEKKRSERDREAHST